MLHFELADYWNALLLLDEADLFLCKCDMDYTHNSLVSVFLRKLECYQGIMFLTTSRVRHFDDAIQSRIHLALRYGPLGVDTRKGIWNTFLQNAITAGGKADHSDDNLNDLAKHDLNGRQVGTCFDVMSSYADRFLLQIRNFDRAAHALASQEGAVTSYSHLETDAMGGSSENMRSYL